MEHKKPQVIASLKQRRFPFGKREITLTTDNQLSIKETSLFRRDLTKIPLEILQGSPAYSKTFSVKWLFNTIILFFLSWTSYMISIEYSLLPLNILTSIFAISGVYALYQFFYFTSDLLIYRNAYTNENYLYLWNKRPNKKKFNDFINKLNLHLDGFEIDKAKSPAEKIELYSHHLAFLHSENIINTEELSRLSKKVYEKALEVEGS